MNKRVAIYIRVSTEEQSIKGVSIEAQRDALLDFIKRNGYVFNEKKHSFIDGGESGASPDRPELEKMMRAARKNEFDLILVWKIDRFFRKTLYLLEYVEYLINFGVGFKSITQDFSTDTSSGKMILGIFGVIAELERDMIRERTSSGKLRKAKEGYYVGGGGKPLGYDFHHNGIGVKLKVNDYEKKIVNRIFELFVKEKKTLGEVAKQLEIEKWKTKSVINNEEKGNDTIGNGKWAVGVISKALKNSMYIGEYYYGKTYKTTNRETKKTIILKSPPEKILTLECEPILDDKSLFYKAQELLEKNKRTRNNKNSHTFAGLIKCDECGRGYYGYNTHNKRTISYRCGGKMKGKLKAGEKICSNHGISEIFLIDTCWKHIYKIFKSPDKALEEYYEKKHKNNNVDRYIRDKEKLVDKKKKYDLGIKKLYKDIALSDSDDEIETKNELLKELNDEKNIIVKEIGILENKINSIKNKMEHLNNLNQLKKYYKKKTENINKEKKIEIIKELVEKIIVYETGELKIIFKFQKENDSDDWRDGIDDKKDFMRDDIDYDDLSYEEGNNESIKKEKGYFSKDKSLTNSQALP